MPVEPHIPSAPIALIDDSRFEAHHDRAGEHPERPERLLAAREGLSAALQGHDTKLIASREITDAELTRVHDARYVERLRRGLELGGYGLLDPDTFYSPGTREAAWLAAGGVVDLTRAIIRGEARRGVALLRPPGHHAIADSSMGFCLLNNIALAAHAALAEGLSRVAIVDWDVHHGNGTQAAFYDDPRVLVVSLHQYPFYPGTGAIDELGTREGRGYTANLPLPEESGPEAYAAAFSRVVLPLLRAYRPELVLVSAGFDAHARDPLASMNLDTYTYGALANTLLDVVDAPGAHAQGRIAFVLEGGYDLYALQDSMREVGRALTGTHNELPQGRLRADEHAIIELAYKLLSAHWPLLL